MMAQYNAGVTGNCAKPQVMRKQLIATSYYALNNSNSKSIAIGIDIIDEKFEPVIKLISNKQSDITIRHKTWKKLCEYFDEIEAYLSNRPYNLDHRTPVDELAIVLTSSFGEPSLLIEVPPSESSRQSTAGAGVPDAVAASAAAVAAAAAAAAGVRGPGPLSNYLNNAASGHFMKQFIPGVIFQLTSFEGLRKAQVCIDLRLQELVENLLAMQIVIDTLVSELQQRLIVANLSLDAEVRVLQGFLAQDCETIKEAVKAKLAERNVSFVNCDVNCFFYEVVLFCMDYVRKYVATWRR